MNGLNFHDEMVSQMNKTHLLLSAEQIAEIRADEIRKFAEFLEKKGLLIDMKFSGDSDWDRLSSKDVIAEYEKEQNDGTR